MLVPFCLLADLGSYRPCAVDLTQEPEYREHWVGFFRDHFRTILALGVRVRVSAGGDPSQATRLADACIGDFHAALDAYLANPAKFGPVTLLTLDAWRDGRLRKYGFFDPFSDTKDRDNATFLPVLPRVLAELDATPLGAQPRFVIEGVLAGNLLDMGAKAVASRLIEKTLDFHQVRSELKPRPWLRDASDELAAALGAKPYRKAVIFVDNAGSDFLLGIVPLSAYLARRGTQVILAANEHPTLNDMTVADIAKWWPKVLEVAPMLAGLPISWVSTGTGEPLIDLSRVSPGLNEVARDADLVILEGMGRSVESNLDARFTCDWASLAMIKDQMVARRLGGTTFDLVCQFHRGILA